MYIMQATDEVNQLRVVMVQKNNEIEQHLKTIDGKFMNE